MGQLCFEAEEYEDAVEDWLSAVACFLEATAREQQSESWISFAVETRMEGFPPSAPTCGNGSGD